MPLRKTGAFRGIAFRRPGAGRSRPDPLWADTPATSDEPERKMKLPGGGLAGAAEDPALLSYAGPCCPRTRSISQGRSSGRSFRCNAARLRSRDRYGVAAHRFFGCGRPRHLLPLPQLPIAD
jgi:hypothetical protein